MGYRLDIRGRIDACGVWGYSADFTSLVGAKSNHGASRRAYPGGDKPRRSHVLKENFGRMATDAATIREYGMAKTQRRDAWWAGPLATGLVLGGFVGYATFR